MICLILFLRVSKNNFAHKNVKEFHPIFLAIVDNFPHSVENLFQAFVFHVAACSNKSKKTYFCLH